MKKNKTIILILALLVLCTTSVFSLTEYNLTNTAGFCDQYSSGECNVTSARTIADNLIIKDFTTLRVTGSVKITSNDKYLVIQNITNLIGTGYIANSPNSVDDSDVESSGEMNVSATNIQDITLYSRGANGVINQVGTDLNGGNGGNVRVITTNITDATIYSEGGDGNKRTGYEGGSGGSSGFLNITGATIFDNATIYTEGGSGNQGDLNAGNRPHAGNAKDIYLESTDVLLSTIYTLGGTGGYCTDAQGGNGGEGGMITLTGDDINQSSLYTQGGNGGRAVNSGFTTGSGGGTGGIVLNIANTIDVDEIYSDAGDCGSVGSNCASSTMEPIVLSATTILSNNINSTTTTPSNSGSINISATDVIINSIKGKAGGTFDINVSDSAELLSVLGGVNSSVINIYGGNYFLGTVNGGSLTIDIVNLTDNNTQDWSVGQTTISSDYLVLNNNLSTTNTVNITINVTTDFYQEQNDTYIQWGDDIVFIANTTQLGDMLFVSSGVIGGFVETKFKWEANQNKFITFVYTGSFTNQVTDNTPVGNATPNNAPTISSIVLDPVIPFIGSGVNCVVTASDVDGDNLTYTYDWSVNGSLLSYNSASLSDANFSVDDPVYCTVSVSDGTDSTNAQSPTGIVTSTNQNEAGSGGGGGGGSSSSDISSSLVVSADTFVDRFGNFRYLTISTVDDYIKSLEPITVDGQTINDISTTVAVYSGGLVEVPITAEITSNSVDFDGDGLYTGPLDDWDGDGIPNYQDVTIFGAETIEVIKYILPEGDETIIPEEETLSEANVLFNRPNYVCLVTATPTMCDSFIQFNLEGDLANLELQIPEELDSVVFCNKFLQCGDSSVLISGDQNFIRVQSVVDEFDSEKLFNDGRIVEEIKIIQGDKISSIPYIIEAGPGFDYIYGLSEDSMFSQSAVRTLLYGGVAIFMLIALFGMIFLASTF